MKSADVLPRLKPALEAFATWLTGTAPPAGSTAEQLAKIYADAKGKQGRAAVAAKLKINENDLTAFDSALREAARRTDRLAPDSPAFESRNAAIAVLRLLGWLETFSQGDPSFAFDAGLPQQGQDEIGRKQVRALELILRSLITERYENQAQLTARLKELLSEKAVQQFMACADRDDILSGTTFSELSSLFVNTDEFPGYEGYYKETPFLSLMKEKRVTIRNYLDDIRRVRNVLAHNKRVTPTQVSLLNAYYEELVEPLQEAFDQGRTKVNPETYLDISSEELDGYFSKLSDDVKAVRDDIAEMRMDLGGRIDRVLEATSAIKDDTTALRRSSVAIAATAGRTNNRVLALLGIGAVTVAAVSVAVWLLLGQGKKTDEIARTAADTARTSERIEGKTDEIKDATQDTAEAASRIEASQERTEAAIAQIAEGFARIDKNGGVIENATRPEEHYHNAIVYEERGDTAKARESYLAFANSDIDAIDVYDRFARLLRTVDGRADAREVFAGLASRLTAPSIKLVYAMQFDDAERTRRMEEFMTANPDYGPGHYLLAQEFSEERTGGQSVADKQREFDLLQKFLGADGQGTLVRHFVDQQVLGGWLDAARLRVKTLEPQLQATRAQPVMQQSRSNQGWTIYFQIPEAALKIFYRLGETGEWVDTGVSGNIDQRTGKPAPQPFFMLPNDAGPQKIGMKYINMNGQEMGPFSFDFVTSSALADEHKRLLEMIWTGWIAIQANPGNPSQTLVYFTGMVSYRCGIAKAMYGLNGGPLDTELVFPPCDEANPMAIPGDFMPFFEAPAGLTSLSVQVTYKDGTQSAVREFKPQ
jgi:methyl-accepting chemotaxis protein